MDLTPDQTILLILMIICVGVILDAVIPMDIGL